MAETHVLCCDCDACIGPGVSAPNAGGTKPTPNDKPPRRSLTLNERLAAALREEEQARQRMHYFGRVARQLSAQEGGR